MTELRRNRRPTVPGIILREHYLVPRNIRVTDLAVALDLSRKHTSQIVNGHKRVEPIVAARLAKVFGTTARFWLNLQTAVDAWDAEQETAVWEPRAMYLDTKDAA